MADTARDEEIDAIKAAWEAVQPGRRERGEVVDICGSPFFSAPPSPPPPSTCMHTAVLLLFSNSLQALRQQFISSRMETAVVPGSSPALLESAPVVVAPPAVAPPSPSSLPSKSTGPTPAVTLSDHLRSQVCSV